MARFILVFFGVIFFFYTLWRIFRGDKLTPIDWVLFFVSLVMLGSVVSYILQSN